MHPLGTRSISLLIACAVAAAAAAGEAVFRAADPTSSTLRIDLRREIEPVNRRVLGVCLIFDPLDEATASTCSGIFDGTSGRAWLGDLAQVPLFKPFWGKVGMRELYGFDPCCHINRIASYTSAAKNNLDPRHQPEAVAALVQGLWDQLPAERRSLAWEVWNEPQFPQDGAWPSEDFARYVIDVSRAVRARCPQVEIGAPLHEDDMEWNRRLLARIAADDPGAISFAITHPYNFSWMALARSMGPYWSRAVGAEVVTARKLAPKADLVRRLGHGRWRLAATEWGTHPEGYGPPYPVSTDMAAAIHSAAMIGAFWEQGVDAAHYFHLRSTKPDSHFRLLAPQAGGLRWTPVGEVFRLYGEWFRGARLATELRTPQVEVPAGGGHPALPVPLVIAQAAHDAQHGRVVVMLANRHPGRGAPIELRLANFRPAMAEARLRTVRSAGPDAGGEAVVEDGVVRLPPGGDPILAMELPPASVRAVVLEGGIPPSEAELFSQRVRFIRGWRVGQVVGPVAGEAHGLRVALTPEQVAPATELAADGGGYVNLASILAVSGRAHDLKEAYQAVASVWVFSPVARKVQLSLGLDYWGSVAVNGTPCVEVVERGGPALPDTVHCSAALQPGWNQLAVRIASGSKGMGFWCGIEQTGDLLFEAAAARPAWPKRWSVGADQGCVLNSHPAKSGVANPDSAVLELAASGAVRRSLLRWPRLALPPGLELASASIELSPLYAKEAGQIRLRPLTAAWDEQTATWEQAPAAGEPLPGSIDQGAPEWVFTGESLTSLVRCWIADSVANHGVAVESQTAGYAGFASDDDPKRVPRLVLESK